MCYAIPGRVKAIKGKTVFVDYFGEEKRAVNEFQDVHVDDYIYAQGGFVIKRISSQEAEEILSAWREMFFELQDIDRQISRIDGTYKDIDRVVARMLDRSLEGRPLRKEEITSLLNLNDERAVSLFFQTANFLRQKYQKNSCCVHGILEISNYCNQRCQYCGISFENRRLNRYRMSPDEVIAAVTEAVDIYGFKALVLQSGEDGIRPVEELQWIIKTIRERLNVLLFVSFGELGIEGLQRLYQAGARGLLMRFETSNRQLYEQLHPGASLNTRLEHIKAAYDMGYLIITGGLIGLPGQTSEDSVNDIFLAKELNAEMYSFGPFLPHPDTALAGALTVDTTEVLKVLAAIRLADPQHARILITTALETRHPEARRSGLLSGANSVMLNVTPVSLRQKYAIYPNRAYSTESIQTQIGDTVSLLTSLGRAPTDLGVRQQQSRDNDEGGSW